MNCCFPNCNSSTRTKNKTTNVKFYHFPKDNELIKKWLIAVNRTDKFSTKAARVCSKHFEESDYKDNLRHKLLNYTPPKHRGLKDDAIPKAVVSAKKAASVRSTTKSGAKRQYQEAILNEALGNIQTKIDMAQTIKAKDDEIQQLREELNAAKKILSERQIAKLKKEKRIKWTIADVSNAITIYAAGPRAYRLMLKRGYPYPAVSTLRAWLKRVVILPGILRNIFKIVEYSNMNNSDKICTIMFDEMEIRQEYVYDRARDETLQPYSYVQVVLLSGLFKRWNQPVFFDFDFKMKKSKLFEIVQFVEQSGFRVVATVCDTCGRNRGLMKELNVSATKPYYLKANGEKVYMFADVAHLLKLIRNHFVDYGFIVNGKEINKAIVEETLNVSSASEVQITHKISKDSLNVKAAQRQKVKYAAKLFSHTVSKSISRCGQLGFLTVDNWIECADFFKLVNDWFDVFNCSTTRVSGLDEQNTILDNMSKTIEAMRVKRKTNMLPFQNGILLSNKALQMLYEDLSKEDCVKYLLTRRLSQDVLENLFGVIRAKGGLHDHPNSVEFKYCLRSYLLGKKQGAYLEHFNVERDDTPALPVSGQILQSIDPQKEDEEPEEWPELVQDGLENVAGFICHKLKISNNDTQCSYSSKAPASLVSKLEELENIFNLANGEKLLTTKGYMANLINQSSHVEVEEEVKKLYFKTRLYQRIRELNKSLNVPTNKRKIAKKSDIEKMQQEEPHLRRVD